MAEHFTHHFTPTGKVVPIALSYVDEHDTQRCVHCAAPIRLKGEPFVVVRLSQFKALLESIETLNKALVAISESLTIA